MARVTDSELHDWALERYGSEYIASDVALARTLYENVETVERHGEFPAGDEIRRDELRAGLNEQLRKAGRNELPGSRSEAV